MNISDLLYALRPRLYPDIFAPAASYGKLDHAIDLGVEGVITPHTDMQSGFERSASLAHQNAPGAHELSAEALNAQTLTDTVTAISRATTCFLMRHGASSVTLLGLLDCRA
jgi:hypothetical protein